MYGENFREMLKTISANVMCSGMECTQCKEYFNVNECPSTNNKYSHQERIEFWDNVYDELNKLIDRDEDLPFPKENWGYEDVIKVILDQWDHWKA